MQKYLVSYLAASGKGGKGLRTVYKEFQAKDEIAARHIGEALAISATGFPECSWEVLTLNSIAKSA